MKNTTLLVFLSQLGLSVALPLAGFIWLAAYLHSRCGWGVWVLFVGVGLGLFCAIDGLRVSLKTMERLSRDKKPPKEPPISFNEHD